MNYEKEECINFKKELESLLEKHQITLYTEDEYGNINNEVMAFKEGVFDTTLKNEDLGNLI